MRDINIFKLILFIVTALVFSFIIILALNMQGVVVSVTSIFIIAIGSILLASVMYFINFLIDRKFLKKINDTIDRISKGSLTAETIDIEGAAAISIKKSLDNFINFLGETLKKIEFSVLDINGNANTLAMFSENISQRIEEERDNIAKITESMSELSSIADSIKEYASAAKELSRVNREKIIQSTESIKNLIQSMNEISTASTAINEVANFIADVADETNLLALNASIEASRAGAEGAGFSIVASEIRNLAENSSSAIKKITDTVERLIKSVTKGVNFSNEAQTALNDIIEGIKDTASKIEEIDSKITTQTDVTKSIHDEIEDVNTLVIQNSELLIEMLGSIQNLSQQSDILKQIAAQFEKEQSEDISSHIYGVNDPSKSDAPKEELSSPDLSNITDITLK